MKKNSNSVFLKNIAEKAGVSVGTVSIVLNGKGDELRISKYTQQKVKEVADELNYTPNIYARRLRAAVENQPSYVVGLFWNLVSINEVIGNYLRCLYLATKKMGIQLEIIVQPYESGKLNQLKEKFDINFFNGIIIANAADSDLDFLKNNDFDIPLVIINRETGKYCNISVNDYEAGRICAKLFADNGHKQVGIIGMKQNSLASRLKTMGFKDGCSENNLIIKDEWILGDTRTNFEGGYSMTKGLMEKEQHPTAILVMYDYFALGAVNACKDLGYNIPDDIAVMVYGNNEVFEHYSPTISSFFFEYEELAESSLNLLLLLIKRDIQSVVNISLSPKFFFRESCKSIKI